MKKATENLVDDHVYIQQLMDVMEHITSESNPDIGTLEFIVRFIREFADGCHHAKEEGLLFPKLIERGIPGNQGPIGVMLFEHDEGRKYVKGMADNIELYKNGRKEALQTVYQNMTGYIELLRSHINKENNILFRMADQVLTDEEQDALFDQFKTAELNTGTENIDNYLSRVKELTAAICT